MGWLSNQLSHRPGLSFFFSIAVQYYSVLVYYYPTSFLLMDIWVAYTLLLLCINNATMSILMLLLFYICQVVTSQQFPRSGFAGSNPLPWCSTILFFCIFVILIDENWCFSVVLVCISLTVNMLSIFSFVCLKAIHTTFSVNRLFTFFLSFKFVSVDWTSDLGIWGWCSNQLSYLARATFCPFHSKFFLSFSYYF